MKNSIQLKLLFFFIAVNVAGYSQVIRDTIYVNTDGIDSYVSGAATGTNYGTDTLMSVFWSGGKAMRTFIDVDLGHIPRNAIVLKTEIKLYALIVNNAVSHPMYVDRVLSSWSETGITFANQPAITSTGRVTLSHAQTSSTGWQTMEITALGQHAVNFPAQNHGWRIALRTESGGTNNGVVYASSEHGNSARRPYVIVEYVLPIQLTASVKHCTSGMDDGAITVSVSDGSETYTSYKWYHYDNGTVTLIQSGSSIATIDIDSLEDGLYLCTVSDDRGTSGYKYFLVGEYGTTTSVEFRNNTSTTDSKLYNEDAQLTWVVSTSDGDRVGPNETSVYAYRSSSVYYSSILKFNVDFDPLFDIQEADLRLISQGHYRNASPATTDSGYVSRVIQNWDEGTVTWNTKPTVTTTDRQTINESASPGGVTRNDTIDLLPFVNHWKNNPTENYGVDISLKYYSQAADAYLRYYSYDNATSTNRPSFLLTYSLPEQVTTDFDDSTETGNILIYAPGYGGEYNYLISDLDTLPELDTIWYALKDTLTTFGVDSVDFYRGGNDSRSYSFTMLQEGKYFVGVYDSKGNKVLDKQVFIRSPFSLVDTTDIIISGDTLKVQSPATVARVKVMGHTNIDESGGIEFKVVSLADDYVFGFNNTVDPSIIFDNDFEYAYRVSSSGDLEILKNGLPLDSSTVSVSDRLKIYKDLDQIVFSKNDIEVLRDTLHPDSLYATKTEVLLKGSDSEVMLVSYYGSKKAKPAIKITPPTCGTINGSINITSMGSYFGYTMDTYYLDNLYSTDYFSGDAPGIISNVPSGIYLLQIIWTNGTYYFPTYQTVYVGHPIIWIQPGTNMTVLPNNGVTRTTSSGVSEISAVNVTNPGVINWMQFSHSKTYGATVSRVSLVNENDEASVELIICAFGINKWAIVYSDGVLQNTEVVSSSYPLMYGSQFVAIPNNQPFRIEEDNGEITVIHDQTTLLDYTSTVIGELTPLVTINPTLSMEGNAQIYSAVVSFCYPKTQPYVKLRRTVDGGYYLAQENILYVEYDEEYNDGSLTFRVYSETDQLEESNSSMTVDAISYGDNRLVFEFSVANGDCIPDGYYILEVINSKNEKLYLRFKIVDSPC